MLGTLEDDSTTGSPRELIDLPGPQSLVVVDWSGDTVQGRKRVRNEDSWRQLGPIFVVSDGMGGLSGGAEASAIASHVVAKEWLAGELNEAQSAVLKANALVRADFTGDEVRGCTLTGLRVAHDQATVVHVGDSRAYRIRNGVVELLTRDHNLRSELMAAGVVPGKTRSFGPLRALTSYLGRPDDQLQVDIRSISLRPGDRLVLCTDGVLDDLSPSEFASRASGGSSADAVRRLTTTRGADDATAIVIDIGVQGD